jgi:hypothetical protein
MIRLRTVLICTMFFILFTAIAADRGGAQVPEKFTNLQVFPKEIGKQELVDAMREISSSLGVRCGYCHAEKEGGPGHEMDWASDALKAKTTARVMMQMTHTINATEIPKITTIHTDRLEVRCRTCHHGLPRPMLIEDVLTGAYQAAGFDSLKTKYEALRKQYYGTDAYNFGERMLPALGEKLAGKDKPQVMVGLAEYNLQWFPDSGIAHLILGQAKGSAGDKEGAVVEVKKAVELDPTLQENANWVLSRLQGK